MRWSCPACRGDEPAPFVAVTMLVGCTATRDGSRRGQHEPPGLDPLGPDQRVGEFSDLPGRPAKEDHLQASPLVQMDVGRGHHLFQVLVLEVRETLGDPPGVVIVDERDDPHGGAVLPVDHLLDQPLHASGPGPPRSDSVAMLPALVEPPQQLAADRHAEANECVLHRESSPCPIPPRHLDPQIAPRRALNGGIQESHPGDAVRDAWVVERLGSGLASSPPDRPFERSMEVRQLPRESPRDGRRAFGGRGESRRARSRSRSPVDTASPAGHSRSARACRNGVRPGQRARGADDAEAAVVLGPRRDLGGGDRGDRPVAQLGQHGEIVVEGPAGDDRLHPGEQADRVQPGHEADELIGMGPMSPPQPEAPAFRGSTLQAACLCPSSSRRVANQPWGYHASTLRISPISPWRTISARASPSGSLCRYARR